MQFLDFLACRWRRERHTEDEGIYSSDTSQTPIHYSEDRERLSLTSKIREQNEKKSLHLIESAPYNEDIQFQNNEAFSMY